MEINIRKKKKPVWPWIVAVLIVLAIIFVLYTQFGDDVEQQINNNDDNSYVEPNEDALMEVTPLYDDIAYYDEVKDFINYVDLNNNEEETQQNYTENATIYLAQALSKMVDLEHTGDSAIEVKRDQLLAVIENLKLDNGSLRQPDLIGTAFSHAAELMSAIQKKDYPALKPQVKNVEKLAKSIQPTNVEDERHVKEFFLLSKVALMAISEIDTL